MTAKEQKFVNACRATNLSDENRAQWEQYCHLPTAEAKTKYAEAVIDKWDAICRAVFKEWEKKVGLDKPTDPKLYTVIPRGQPHPLYDTGAQIYKGTQRICDDDLARQAKEQPPDGGNRKGVGKVKVNLVFHDMAEALHEVCKVMTEGAKKHEPKGWLRVPNGIYEYTEALNRHINAESRGELRDREWDLLHSAHAACCALIRAQLIINELKENGGVLPEGVVKKPMSEQVRKNIAEMMVVDDHQLKFKIGPGDPTAWKPITITGKLREYKSDPVTVEEFRFKKSVAKRLMKEGGEKQMVKAKKAVKAAPAKKAVVAKKAMAAAPMMAAAKGGCKRK